VSPPITAILDACVLYGARLRSFLMYLAMSDLLWARWTHRIHEEWMRNVLENYPHLTREKLERTRDLMDRHALDAIVTDYEDLVASLTLPDPDDRHVLAAAIRAGADAIVTFNLADFPAEVLAEFDLEALHPDDLLERLIDLDVEAVCAAARQDRVSLKNPPKSVDEYLTDLERAGIPRTVAALRPFSERL
jgi:predicted nucleic acid-binding protein